MFPSHDLKGEVVSYKSYFLAKKIYLDLLKDKSSDLKGYHIRMKGIGENIVVEHANNGIEDIYSRLLNNEKIPFDMIANNRVRFNMGKDFRTRNQLKFVRVISV